MAGLRKADRRKSGPSKGTTDSCTPAYSKKPIFDPVQVVRVLAPAGCVDLHLYAGNAVASTPGSSIQTGIGIGERHTLL